MDHLLDNPVWNALSTGNSSLANGNDQVKFYDKEVSPLVGLKEFSKDHFGILHELINSPRILAVVSPGEIVIPDQWKAINHIKILQMVFDGSIPPAPVSHEFIPLQRQHVPAMIALTNMTNPGPFSERTIDFGNYQGIFKNNELIAMAGWRMQPSPYIEISAVCTHPDHHGNGYASLLMNYHITKIIRASGIPFLHVRSDNANAIKLYKKRGFFTRKELDFTVFQKK